MRKETALDSTELCATNKKLTLQNSETIIIAILVTSKLSNIRKTRKVKIS